MKNIFFSIVLLAIIFQSCKKKDDPVAAPVACFTSDVTESTDSAHSFLFDQCPPAYDLSYWDFDDGQYSSNPNPAHVFHNYGSYNVKLTVTNTAGATNSVTKTIRVGHYSLDKIVYTQTWTQFTFPKIVSFTNCSLHMFSIDTIPGQSSLPYTHQLLDSLHYDLTDTTCAYDYQEANSFHHHFYAYPSSFINKRLDVVISNMPVPTDTAKLSLYFKFVPR